MVAGNPYFGIDRSGVRGKGIATVTANYTLDRDNEGKDLLVNSSTAITITAPIHANAPFIIGQTVRIRNQGAGLCSFAGATGVTITGIPYLLRDQVGLLRKITQTSWHCELISGSAFLLPQLPSAYSYYGIRNTSPTYTGPLVNMRRSTDDENKDFWPGNGVWIDDEYVQDWLGAGTGFIEWWYDISGNGRHVSNVTHSQQPTYKQSGIGGYPTITFGGPVVHLFRTLNNDGVYHNVQSATFSMVTESDTPGDSARWWAEGDISGSSNPTYSWMLDITDEVVQSFHRDDGASIFETGEFSLKAFDNTPRVISVLDAAGVAVNSYVDGALDPVTHTYTRGTLSNQNTQCVGALRIKGFIATNPYVGDISEMGVFDSVLSDTHMKLMHAEQMGIFGI